MGGRACPAQRGARTQREGYPCYAVHCSASAWAALCSCGVPLVLLLGWHSSPSALLACEFMNVSDVGLQLPRSRSAPSVRNANMPLAKPAPVVGHHAPCSNPSPCPGPNPRPPPSASPGPCRGHGAPPAVCAAGRAARVRASGTGQPREHCGEEAQDAGPVQSGPRGWGRGRGLGCLQSGTVEEEGAGGRFWVGWGAGGWRLNL